MKLDPSRRDDYEIITALRGPDASGGDYAKAVSTAVLRYFVGCMPGNGGSVYTPETARSTYEFYDINRRATIKHFFNMQWHYTSHLRMGFDALINRLKRQRKNRALLQQAKAYRAFLSREFGI